MSRSLWRYGRKFVEAKCLSRFLDVTARCASDDDITSVASEDRFLTRGRLSDLTFHRLRISQILLGVQVHMIALASLLNTGFFITSPLADSSYRRLRMAAPPDAPAGFTRPVVFFDIQIGESKLPRIKMELFSDIVPK